jgi:hydroxyquinol 1,2-dioxygenase
MKSGVWYRQFWEGLGGMDGAKAQDLDGRVQALASRVTADRQDRVVQALLASVLQVHDLLRDLRPSPREWRAVIDFLTDVGHAADSRRQEWVLLSDVIGASALIEDMNSARPAGATPNTLAGPFYRADVPEMENGADISRDGIGKRLKVSGRVTGLDGQAVARAMVEVWQANSFGVYENQQPDLQPEFNLRGRFVADHLGEFHFTTVCPSGYSLPDDGPVGRLLSAIGVTMVRPAHLHFRVTAPGYQILTTHIYDRSDPAIGNDALFCVKPDLLGDFRPTMTTTGPEHMLEVSFVLVRLDATDHQIPANRS